MEKGRCSVCVTGGAGYIASSLVKKLLGEGYIVHATLRNLNDSTKVQLLRSFCGAEERLKLFEANMYKPEQFEAAIQGCEFVFHVATPLLHTEGYKHTNRVDATVDAARSIATACIRSRTEFMDETCWTPLNFSTPYDNETLEVRTDHIQSNNRGFDFQMRKTALVNSLGDYTRAKTLAEKELLSFGSGNAGEMEVVTLPCGLVGGDGLVPYLSTTSAVFLAQLTNDELALNSLNFLQQLLAKIPVVHIEDVSNAHIFCMKEASMTGRFLCANGYVSTAEIASYYQQKYPELSIKKEHFECPKYETKWASNLLAEKGFQYQYDWQKVLDDCITCARKTKYGVFKDFHLI
ncbi:putative anthocyanidin reductase [Sesamum angolense]|uniref:Anthocyanidin reductase n=1 Tax=Sesamum angolense TaxID=2727404 RepID=A0AAE2BTI0_9LAMI|nr:putative anthocyanidin reductase [Sesamum angolense]